jgi:hypothetical protein
MESEKSTIYLDQGRFEPLLEPPCKTPTRPRGDTSEKYTSDVVSYRYETIFEIDKVRTRTAYYIIIHCPINSQCNPKAKSADKEGRLQREASVRRLFNKVSPVAFL